MAIRGIVRDEAGQGLNGVLVRAHRTDTGAILGENSSHSVQVGDPWWSMVQLQLTFDGGAAVDASPNAFVVGAAGGAQVVPYADEYMGPGGYMLDCTDPGNNARVVLPATPVLRAQGAFCLDFWFRMAAAADSHVLAGVSTPGSNTDQKRVEFGATAAGAFYAHVLGMDFSTPDGFYNVGEFYHIAVQQSPNGTVSFFVDGDLAGGGTEAHVTGEWMPGDPIWQFGAYPEWFGNATGGKCHLANIRLVIGNSRYDPDNWNAPGTIEPGRDVSGAYEIEAFHNAEIYVVCLAPDGSPRNHLVHRTHF